MNYLLIWDIDGTLIQGRSIGSRSMRKAFYELYNIEDGFKGISMSGRLDSIILEDAFRLHSLEGKDKNEYFKKYSDVLRMEINNLDYSIEAPGILNLLEALEANGSFYNALGTGNMEKGARLKLTVHDMNKYFPVGGFGDEKMERWQVIEKAAITARKHFCIDFSKEEIYVIGDTPRDIECGKILNFKTIGVATGPHSSQELKAYGADYVFEDLSDINGFMNIFTK